MNWRDLEADFRAIPDPYADLRADLNRQTGQPDDWRLAGSADWRKRARFEAIANMAGNFLLASPAASTRFSSEILADPKPLTRWLRVLASQTGNFTSGPVCEVCASDGSLSATVYTGSIGRVIEASALLCLELTAAELPAVTDKRPTMAVRLHIDDIDSFDKVRMVKPADVQDVLSGDGRIDILEEEIKIALESILAAPMHKKDWGGEECDLYSSNVTVWGQRLSAAFSLKGRGVTSKTLRLRDCGASGDQLVRLFHAPAQLFVVQYVGNISENVIEDVDSKARALRASEKRAWFCIMDGQDTARLLRAYGKR